MRIAVGALATILATLACAQSSATSPRFDATDVRPSGPALNPFSYVSGGVLRGERYDLRKATLRDLIRIAYQVAPEDIVGGPDWLEFDRFDIAARAPASTPPETVRLMLQALLLDRFRLTIRMDSRPMPAYALSVGKAKPKLEAASGSDGECRWGTQPAGSTWITYMCRGVDMTTFVARLRSAGSDYLKEPLVDKTGLQGTWDLSLTWNPRSQPLPEGTKRTTLFDAVEKDLGLSLSLRNEPGAVFVIDRAERPTANAPDIAQKLPPRDPTFELATLKLNKNPRMAPFTVTRGGLRIPSAPLKTVLGFAWDMNTIQTGGRFIGLPKGIDDVDVTIDARTSKEANAPGLDAAAEVDDDLRAMTRALLTERFQMKWHYENRPMDGYSLVAAKPKLKRAAAGQRSGCREARTMANDPRDANPWLTDVFQCRNVTIAQFASTLQQLDNRQFVYPVEDATGIKGTFDFDLSFSASRLMERPDAALNGAVSLGEAINRELGLKLEMRKRSLPAIVVEHMELVPTEN